MKKCVCLLPRRQFYASTLRILSTTTFCTYPMTHPYILCSRGRHLQALAATAEVGGTTPMWTVDVRRTISVGVNTW